MKPRRKRTCLICNKTFFSFGPQNRICRECVRTYKTKFDSVSFGENYADFIYEISPDDDIDTNREIQNSNANERR
jgi:protein-arginine kinase activator protein McsA